MNKILLSQQKIDTLKKELKLIKEEIFKHQSQDYEEGLMAYSFKDAAVSEGSIKPKMKRATEIKHLLKNSEILPDKIDSEKAVIGSWVTFELDLEKKKFRLVSPQESDPANNLLSVKTPLGKQLLDKKVGDLIQFNKRKIKIKSID